MNPVWHPLWLAVQTAAWFLSVGLVILGGYKLAAGLTRRQMSIRMVVVVIAAGLALGATGCQRAAHQPAQQPTAEPMEGMEGQIINVAAKEFVFDPKEIRVKAGGEIPGQERGDRWSTSS